MKSPFWDSVEEKTGQLFNSQIRPPVLGKAGGCSEPLQLPQIPQLELYSWDKVVGMKNSSYKKRPSRGADPAGPVVRSAAEPPVGWRAAQEHAQRASLALYFYNKTGTGRTGLRGRLRDRGYLQRGNFTSGNISSLRSPRGRMLKYYDKKKKQQGCAAHTCKVGTGATVAAFPR